VPADDYYRVTTADDGDDALVAVSGEIDLHAQDRLQEVIDEARSGGRRLVIDLSQTTFIDSCGLRVLVNALRAQSDAGAEMVLRAPSDPVRAVIEMAGLRDLLPVD
jgi:anti-sigma B factor antagonist